MSSLEWRQSISIRHKSDLSKCSKALNSIKIWVWCSCSSWYCRHRVTHPSCLLNPVATQMPWSTQVLFKVQSITDRIVRPCNYIEPSSCTDSLVLTPLLNLESSVAILLTAHGTCTWYSDNLVQVLVLQYKYDTVCRQAINNVCNECDTECVTSTGYCGWELRITELGVHVRDKLKGTSTGTVSPVWRIRVITEKIGQHIEHDAQPVGQRNKPPNVWPK